MENIGKNKCREWTTDDIYLLIDLYREKPRLWDPTHKEYKFKSKTRDDWKEISNILNCDVTDVRKKVESLLTSFRRERHRCEQTKKSGAGTEDIYNSQWFAFEKMKFLIEKFTPRVTLDTLDTADDSSNVTVEKNTDNNFNNPTSSTSNVSKSPKKMKFGKNTILNQRAEEAYNNMQQALKRRNDRDSSDTFGEHVANKHRTYSSRTKSLVEHFIGNIFFEADMGRYDANDGVDMLQSNWSTSSPALKK